MKKLVLLAIGILVTGVALAAMFKPAASLNPPASLNPHAPLANGPQVYQEAPGFVLVDTWGDKVRLADFRGKIVILHFWAEWCGSCKEELRHFQRIQEKYSSAEVVVLGLAYASGDRERVRGIVDDLGVTYPIVVCDEETWNRYQVVCLPTNIVVDRVGKMRYVTSRHMNLDAWERILGEIIAEQVG